MSLSKFAPMAFSISGSRNIGYNRVPRIFLSSPFIFASHQRYLVTSRLQFFPPPNNQQKCSSNQRIILFRSRILGHHGTRSFKNQPNSFINKRESFGVKAFESTLLFLGFSSFFSYFIDWNWVRVRLPELFQNAYAASKREIHEIFLKLKPKKADSLAQSAQLAVVAQSKHDADKSAYESYLNKDESDENNNNNNTNSDDDHDKAEMIEKSSILSSILYYFNVKRGQELKEGGFRDKKIIEYENRIRLYSNPDKIFRYFASIKIVYGNGDSEIYMTPDDFLRSLTPGVKQPDGLGLDSYKRIDLSKSATDEIGLGSMLDQLMLAEKDDFKYRLKPDSIFFKLSKYGLINFSDFLFMLTLISVSKRHFEIAFRMFDLNGDGDVEYEEFEKVQSAILAQTSIGQKMGKSVHYKGISSAVARYFFGENLKRRLTTEAFTDFHDKLQTELLTIEFDRKTPNSNGNICEMDFAQLLVAYTALSEKKRERMLRRVMKKFDNSNSPGITIDEYLNFFRFLQNINDVDVALSVYNLAGASIDQATLKHVARTVVHVDLSDHLVEVVFALFDENEDNQLSNKEFVSVMKERLRRGLSKPKDTGFLKIMHAIWKSLTTFEM